MRGLRKSTPRGWPIILNILRAGKPPNSLPEISPHLYYSASHVHSSTCSKTINRGWFCRRQYWEASRRPVACIFYAYANRADSAVVHLGHLDLAASPDCDYRYCQQEVRGGCRCNQSNHLVTARFWASAYHHWPRIQPLLNVCWGNALYLQAEE